MPSSRVQPVLYRWADHVRACSIEGQLVLLDLRLSKYIGISGPRLDALLPYIPGADARHAAVAPAADAGDDTLVQQLIAKELLVHTCTDGPAATPIPEPLQSACTNRALPFSRRSLGDLASLAMAAIAARRWMNRLSLAQIQDCVLRLRQHNLAGAEPANHSELPEAVASYVCLRPFLYSAHDQCLHDSLTLVGFLARRGLFPSWVIGVRTQPFAAHSWVQAGSIVLNDQHEHVRTYTPILVV